MSTVYTDNYALYNKGEKGLQGFQGQTKKNIQEKYEAATLAAASTIYMFIPPVGAVFTGMGKLFWDDLGTSISLSVGIVGATTKFLAATACGSAAGEIDLAGGVDALGYTFDGATAVILTMSDTGTATGTIGLSMDFQAH